MNVCHVAGQREQTAAGFSAVGCARCKQMPLDIARADTKPPRFNQAFAFDVDGFAVTPRARIIMPNNDVTATRRIAA